jgi:FMN-dependent NADH-azoreductase
MAKLLYIQASPQDGRSRSIQVADAFLAAYRKAHPGDEVVTIDLFRKDLPAFDGAILDAKYAIMHGKKHSPEQAKAWKVVEAIIAEFISADKYLLAVPMWNFGIPYRLKHYLDILLQPGYTFSFSPEKGYEGLVKGRPCMIAFARGGDYENADPSAVDFQKRYLELALGFIGITDIRSVVVQPTLAGGPEVASHKTAAAIAEAKKLAEKF